MLQSSVIGNLHKLHLAAPYSSSANDFWRYAQETHSMLLRHADQLPKETLKRRHCDLDVDIKLDIIPLLPNAIDEWQ